MFFIQFYDLMSAKPPISHKLDFQSHYYFKKQAKFKRKNEKSFPGPLPPKNIMQCSASLMYFIHQKMYSILQHIVRSSCVGFLRRKTGFVRRRKYACSWSSIKARGANWGKIKILPGKVVLSVLIEVFYIFQTFNILMKPSRY